MFKKLFMMLVAFICVNSVVANADTVTIVNKTGTAISFDVQNLHHATLPIILPDSTGVITSEMVAKACPPNIKICGVVPTIKTEQGIQTLGIFSFSMPSAKLLAAGASVDCLYCRPRFHPVWDNNTLTVLTYVLQQS